MFNHNEITTFRSIRTPFYYYDMALLDDTLAALSRATQKFDVEVHYALKANTNKPILEKIRTAGFGADCVSGNELRAALENGFAAEKIVFAGVGKTDEEILFALRNKISCLNVESVHELEVIQELANQHGYTAPIALRINPDVDASTNPKITTGTKLDKFGIGLDEIQTSIQLIKHFPALQFKGLHFHIGSQITDLQVFASLAERVNEIQKTFIENGLFPEVLNLGGGLGIDYQNPDANAIPHFEEYFGAIFETLETHSGQSVHFELGRSIVAQCGNLISKVLYLKKSGQIDFVIIDAGMNNLMRPALYGASHKIQNLVSIGIEAVYQVAGPVCESSDIFDRNVSLPETKRGDLLAIRSAGAYGEVMSSNYNLRESAQAIYSNDFGNVNLKRVDG